MHLETVYLNVDNEFVYYNLCVMLKQTTASVDNFANHVTEH